MSKAKPIKQAMSYWVDRVSDATMATSLNYHPGVGWERVGKKEYLRIIALKKARQYGN